MERVKVRVLLVVGEGETAVAELVTPWHGARNPMRVSAGVVAADAGLPVGELAGREFWAVGDGRSVLGEFELVDDPRL